METSLRSDGKSGATGRDVSNSRRTIFVMPIFLRWLLRLGPINPITVRLVQGGSRRKRHLYIRSIYLGALIITLLYLLLQNAGSGSLDYRGLASAASTTFQIVAYLQIGLICILAPVFMAGAIAQEANPRTWDILLTTPLGAAEIVLGNLFGRLFFILALLFSSLPLFALTQYFGGVPGSSILTSYMIAACAALLVGSMAIALSVSRLVGKRAVFAFYVSVVSYLAITWLVDRVTSTGAVTWMTALNPFLALRALLDSTGYPRAPLGSKTGLASWFLESPVGTWCALSSGLSLFLMVSSTFTVRAGGLAGASGSSGVPWYRRVLGLAGKGGEGEQERQRPPRQVWHNPIAWREAAARNATLGRMVARWSFIGVGALFALGLVVYFHGGGLTADSFRTVLLYSVLGELGVVVLVAMNMASTAVAREREDGTLDLLLTTPITPASYLGGKVRGMIAYLLPLLAVPVGTLFLAGLYVGLVQAGVMSHLAISGGGGDAGGFDGVTVAYRPPTTGTPITLMIPAVLPEAGILAAIVVVPFTAFCCMVGLQWSLKSKGTISAVVATVGVVGVIAGIVGLCAAKGGSGLSLVGPTLAALSPGSLVFATVVPEEGLTATINGTGLSSAPEGGLSIARIGLTIGCLIAAGIYIGVVYGMRASMVHGFDMTVRRLAGTS